MSTIMKRFVKGIVLRGESSDVSENAEGSLFQNSTELRLKTYIEGAVRQIVTNSQEQTLTNKTIDADNNIISNIETDNLKSGVLNTSTTLASASNTQIPSALAVKTYTDNTSGTVATNLSTHINNATGAHAASAISNTPSGNLEATTVQAALNELQSDIDTRATSTALTNHITNTTGAHAASAISNTPSGNLVGATVQAALNELQGDIDTLNSNKVTGPASATDNALVRFDLTTGKLVQNSAGILSDTGSLTGLSDIKIDDPATLGIKLTIDKTGIYDRLRNQGIEFSEAGSVINLNISANNIALDGSTVLPVKVDNTVVGTNALINPSSFSNVLLTNGTLVSVREIMARTEGTLLILTNNTGNDVEIINNHSSTDGIITGTESDITFRNQSSLFLTYSEQLSRWILVGGTGGATSSVKLTAGEALNVNDCVYIDKGDGLVYKASNNNDDKADVLGFVRKATTLGNPVEVVTSGVIKGFTALSPGKLYYLDLNGAISEFAPTLNGTWIVSVAMAVSSTEIVINPVPSSSAIYLTDSEYVLGLPNNISTPDNVSDLVFDPIQVRSFIVDYSIYREDSLQGKAQIGQLRGVYNSRNGVWLISDDFAGENAGVEFSVTPSGQVQYTTSNFTGAGHDCTMKYTIRRTFTI